MVRRGRAPRVELLLAALDEAYDRVSWHGPNLRGSLRGLDAESASWRLGRRRHNAWEIALHAAYWKQAAWRRLTGEKRGSFPRSGSNWFPSPALPTEALWRGDLALLRDCHLRLRAAVAALGDRDLARRSPGGGRDSVARLVRGIAAHDLYHAGQIQLLKRLRRG